MYNIRNGTLVDLHNCVSIFYSTIRGRPNKYKLTKYHAKLDIQNFFLPLELHANVWNFLHNDIVGCKTAHGFNVKLKTLEVTHFLKGQHVRPN